MHLFQSKPRQFLGLCNLFRILLPNFASVAWINIHTDNSLQFLSKLFATMYILLELKHLTTTALHPQSISQDEKFNKRIVPLLLHVIAVHQRIGTLTCKPSSICIACKSLFPLIANYTPRRGVGIRLDRKNSAVRAIYLQAPSAEHWYSHYLKDSEHAYKLLAQFLGVTNTERRSYMSTTMIGELARHQPSGREIMFS